MKKLFMACGMFVATFLLLTINVGGKTLFEHLYQMAKPLTTKAQSGIEGVMGRGVEGTRSVGQQLFNNSVPASTQSAIPSSGAARNFKAPEEKLSEAEKKELDSLIKGYAKD
jgi:hypothetical protein